MEDVRIFNGHLAYLTIVLVYFVAIWYILWQFGIFYSYLVYFPVLSCWQPWLISVETNTDRKNTTAMCSLGPT
jgi:hypothetical protein